MTELCTSTAREQIDGISRRTLLGAALAAPFASPAAAQRPSLGALAASKGILFGASSSWEIFNEPDYGALIAREARILVTDKALKFDYIRPSEDRYSFEEADALLGFAQKHGMLLRGHTLIWNDNPPRWLKGKSKAQLEYIFDAHIEHVGQRYAGKLQSWDVVNEPFWPGDRKPRGFRAGPWYEAMGETYVERAFKRLGRVDPISLFTLNEAQTERDDELGRSIRAGMLPLIDRLLDAGVRLNAIGLQAHLKPQDAFDIDAFLRFLDEIARRRLDIYLSEFDVDDISFPAETGARDAAVAAFATRFLGPVLQNKAVKALITWHLSDRHTWYREPSVVKFRRTTLPSRPLPFDDQFKEKPLAQAIRQALEAAPVRG